MQDPWRCDLCHDVIGVYEPVVIVEGAHERVSSRAALRDVDLVGERYHQACAAQRYARATRPQVAAEEQRRAA